MISYEELQALVDDLVRDDAGRLSESARDQAIELARLQYSKDRPRTEVEELTADGALFPLPSLWDSANSRIVTSELNGRQVTAYAVKTLSGQGVHVRDAYVLSGDKLTATYTTLHDLNESTSTISVTDAEAVAAWAASVLLGQLSSLTAGDEDATIDVDAVNHESRTVHFDRRSRRMRDKYYEVLGLKPNKQPAASRTKPYRMPSGRGRMFRRGGRV